MAVVECLPLYCTLLIVYNRPIRTVVVFYVAHYVYWKTCNIFYFAAETYSH